MQDRYAGDIGDFGKFHLLRYLFLDTSIKLTQLWYKHQNESHNNDGLHINYFEKVKGFDPILEQALFSLVSKKRTIQALEKLELLHNISYFSKNIEGDLLYRKSWIQDAIKFTEGSDFILTDSDNGIATQYDKKSDEIKLLGFEDYTKKVKAGKYIFLDEIDLLHQTQSSIILYHHLNRTLPHNEQIRRIQKQFDIRYGYTLAIKHKPYSPRVYFIVCQSKEVYELIRLKLRCFYDMFSVHWDVFE